MNGVLFITSQNSDIVTRKATIGAELALVQEFIDYRVASFKRKNPNKCLAIFSEPQIELAFPDIVFAEYDISSFEQWNEKRKSLTTQDLKILYYLFEKRKENSGNIIKQLGVSYMVLLKSLESLLDADLIQRTGGKWEIKDRATVFCVKRIQAVEAKLNRWDTVLPQAVRNMRFSSESYVLSELKTEPTAQTIEQFSELGIGMYVKSSSKFKRINKARQNHIPGSYTSLWIGEQIGKALYAC